MADGDKEKIKEQPHGRSESKNVFNFDKPFSVIVKRIYPSTKGEKTDEEESFLFAYDDVQLMARKAQCSVQSLELKNFHRNWPGDSFSYDAAGNPVRVKASMKLVDYVELQPNKGAGSHLTIQWTRKSSRDAAEILKKLNDDKGNKQLDREWGLKGNTEISNSAAVKSIMDAVQSIKMDKPATNGTPSRLAAEDWKTVVEGNQILYAFQLDTAAFEQLRKTPLSTFVTSGPAGTSGDFSNLEDMKKEAELLLNKANAMKKLTDLEDSVNAKLNVLKEKTKKWEDDVPQQWRQGWADICQAAKMPQEQEDAAALKKKGEDEKSAAENGQDPAKIQEWAADQAAKTQAETDVVAEQSSREAAKVEVTKAEVALTEFNQQAYAKGNGPSDETANLGYMNVTSASNSEPITPVKRSVRPAFTIHPGATARPVTKKTGEPSDGKEQSETDYRSTDEQENANSGLPNAFVHSGTIWCNSKSVSTTTVEKTTNSIQQWSLTAGMSKESYGGGLGFSIGQVNFGAKYGFQREIKTEQTSEIAVDTAHLNIVHDVPTAQVNLNETTVTLSADAEIDIRRLRRDRNFADLMTFQAKYGSLVFQNITLGGRLYHTESMQSVTESNESTYTERKKHEAHANLGIPHANFEFNFTKEKNFETKDGEKTTDRAEFLSWNGVGGNPGLVVDPPKWRDSLNDFNTWSIIKYEKPLRIDHFIGRLPGYSDVPLLFSQIISTGVLNQSVITFPPEGLTKENGFDQPSLGNGIMTRTGSMATGISQAVKDSDTREAIVAPECFSWAVFLSDREVKREIQANLQASFNTAANVPYEAPFLRKIRVDADTFTVMLRWRSMTVKKALNRDWRSLLPSTTKAADNKLSGDLFFSSLESRAWAICLWKVHRDKSVKPPHALSPNNLDDIRLDARKYFATPKSIEQGCDYFLKPGSMISKAKISVVMYASDGPGKKEKDLEGVSSPQRAYNAIHRCMRLSSINMLPVRGTVQSYGDYANPYKELKVDVLMRMQEYRASVLFLNTKDPKEVLLASEAGDIEALFGEKAYEGDYSKLDEDVANAEYNPYLPYEVEK